MAQAKGAMFAEAATQYVARHQAGCRNPKHRQQWRPDRPLQGGLPARVFTRLTTLMQHALAKRISLRS